jgi:hypothetical protein
MTHVVAQYRNVSRKRQGGTIYPSDYHRTHYMSSGIAYSLEHHMLRSEANACRQARA